MSSASSVTRLRIGSPAAGAGPWPARAGTAVGLVAALAAVAGVALHVSNRGAAPAEGVTDWWLAQACAAASFGGVGTWLVRARPALPVGWLLLAVGTGQAFSLLGLEYGVRALDRGSSVVPGDLALWAANLLWSPSFVAVGAVLPLVLPDGRLPGRRWRWALALSAAGIVSATTMWALLPYDAWSPSLAAAGASNPFGVDVVAEPLLEGGLTVVPVAAVLVALAGAGVRWHRATPDERQQLKWVAVGAVATVLLYAAGFAVGPVATAAAMVPLPAACLVAAYRYGLWDVDVVITRGLVLGLLTVAVVALYVVVVAAVGAALGRTTGAPILATALVAVLVEPLHRRLRTAVNRAVHGEAVDPLTALTDLGRRLRETPDAETTGGRLLPELVESLAAALRVPYAAVRLRDGFTVVSGTPEAGTGLEVPLTYDGASVGVLLVGQRPGGAGALSAVDRRRLHRLAGEAGAAAHALLLTRELRRSRELVVSAREEERRRVHRDLHDGLGPSLAALALQVEAARELLPTQQDRARQVLDAVVPRLRSTVEEVREVVHGLRPPALDDLGLAVALRELGGRFATDRRAVHVRVADLPPLPAAAEVAAYRIVGEALTNAARHADATAVSVVVATSGTPSMLVLEVCDDGCGLPGSGDGTGVGVASMRGRAEELGGTLDVGPGEGSRGTRVRALLPLGQP